MKNLKLYKGLLALSLAFSRTMTAGAKEKNDSAHNEISSNSFVSSLDDIWLEEPVLGFDLSANNNELDANWQVLDNVFDFAILRCSIGLEKDTKYDYFYNKCNGNNISTGAYFYNKCYHNDNFDEFKDNVINQSDTAIDSLKNKDIIYPVYLDIEDGNKKISDLSNEELNFLIDEWYKKATHNGYIPGIYCNKNIYDILKNKVDHSLLNSFELWISGSKYYYKDSIDKTLSIDDISYQDNMLDNRKYSMNQISNIIAGEGFPVNDYNHMDVDYCYVDYDNYKDLSNDKKEKKGMKVFLLSLGGLASIATFSKAAATKISYEIKVRKKKKSFK